MDATPLGMTEQELRDALSDELAVAFRTEHGMTIHGLAHSIARVIALDHLRIAEQLEREEFGRPSLRSDSAEAPGLPEGGPATAGAVRQDFVWRDSRLCVA